MGTKTGRLQGQSVYLPCKGSILIIALWSLVLLTSFAITLSYNIRQKLTVIKRLEEREKLRLIADAGIKKAIFEVRRFYDSEGVYHTLNDALSINDTFRDILIGDGRFTIAYSFINEEGLVSMQYGLMDEERKININKTKNDIIKNLLMIALNLDDFDAQELANAIVDWRDEDNTSITSDAEDAYYRSLPHPYEAKDKFYEIFEELLLVKGMTLDYYDRLINHVTIYGDGKININTASKEVLLALNLDKDLVEGIILFRKGLDGIAGTSDDNVFSDALAIKASLLSFDINLDKYMGAGSEFERIISEEALSVTSSNFKVNCIARLDNSRDTIESVAFIDKYGNVLQRR